MLLRRAERAVIVHGPCKGAGCVGAFVAPLAGGMLANSLRSPGCFHPDGFMLLLAVTYYCLHGAHVSVSVFTMSRDVRPRPSLALLCHVRWRLRDPDGPVLRAGVAPFCV